MNYHQGPPNRGPPSHSGGMYHPQQQHRSNYGPSGQGNVSFLVISIDKLM